MFEHILIAIDGSDESLQGVPAAIEIAREFNSDVFVLHVRERDLGRAGAFPLETSEEANRLVAETIKTVREAGITVNGQVHGAVTGHAAKDIVETARARGSDLIVMGSRGLSDIAGLLLGSVTHKVMQLAHTPVLVVRPAESPASNRGPCRHRGGSAGVASPGYELRASTPRWTSAGRTPADGTDRVANTPSATVQSNMATAGLTT